MDEHSGFEAAFRPGAKFIDSDGEVLTIRVVYTSQHVGRGEQGSRP